MSWFGKLFGTDAAVEKTIGYARDLIDESFYTDQEEAADRAVARKEAQGMVIEWINASQGSRLSRRIIALSITGTWLSIFIVATLLGVAASWAGEPNQILTAAGFLDARADMMNSAVMLILGFYFAAPYMGDLAKGALQRFGKRS